MKAVRLLPRRRGRGEDGWVTISNRLPYCSGEVAIGPPDVAAMRRADRGGSVTSWLNDALTRDDIVYFTITERGRLVGQIVLHDLDWSPGESLVGYFLFDSADRGRGVGTRIVRERFLSPTVEGVPAGQGG